MNTAPPGVMTSSACLGAELLLKLLGNYCRNADIRTTITVGVVGESHDLNARSHDHHMTRRPP